MRDGWAKVEWDGGGEWRVKVPTKGTRPSYQPDIITPNEFQNGTSPPHDEKDMSSFKYSELTFVLACI